MLENGSRVLPENNKFRSQTQYSHNIYIYTGRLLAVDYVDT